MYIYIYIYVHTHTHTHTHTHLSIYKQTFMLDVINHYSASQVKLFLSFLSL